MDKKTKVLLLGATGSIGRSTLEVLRAYPDNFELVGVVAGSNWQKLAEIATEFGVRAAAINNQSCEASLRSVLPSQCKLFSGVEGVIELVKSVTADICVSAIVGSDGLLPTITALEQGMDIALANKESLVAAGDLLIKMAEEKAVRIIPVDSEHSGIFQSLQAGRASEIERIIITASGGAFRDASRKELERATVEQALRHPTWSMGKKITIDCATLANKGLEVIEAYWLFGVSYDSIEVLVHRESIVHALVEFCDGSIMAQMATADMTLPILYALNFPQRQSFSTPRVDFASIGRLSFELPARELFPMLELAYAAGRQGALAPAVYSAANEEAVRLFLQGKLGFMQIPRSVEYALSRINTNLHVTLNNILSVEEEAHAYVKDFVGSIVC